MVDMLVITVVERHFRLGLKSTIFIRIFCTKYSPKKSGRLIHAVCIEKLIHAVCIEKKTYTCIEKLWKMIFDNVWEPCP